MKEKVGRRKFIVTSVGALVAGLGGTAYFECGNVEVRHQTVPLAGLPDGFHGCRIALLADPHHGWFIPRSHISGAVALANSLKPDLTLLLGDYIDGEAAYIAPVMEDLSRLRAPLGVFAIQGNRDIRVNRVLTSRELAARRIPELTNSGRWIERGGSRLWLCGFDDATTGCPDVRAALNGAPTGAAVIAMTHNPDLTESLTDERIRLVCCGHTHGGQINLPLVGRPFVPSAFGQKYAIGLVRAPHTKTFVSAGVGSVFPPVRIGCPAEVALLTLVPA